MDDNTLYLVIALAIAAIAIIYAVSMRNNVKAKVSKKGFELDASNSGNFAKMSGSNGSKILQYANHDSPNKAEMENSHFSGIEQGGEKDELPIEKNKNKVKNNDKKDEQ